MTVSAAALETLAGLRIEDGRPWGEAAHPFQWDDAAAVLDVAPEAPRLHFLTRPRGGSKTGDSGAIALAAMLHQLAPHERVVVIAADGEQAALVIQVIVGLLFRTPAARAMFRVEARKVIVRRGPSTGAELEVVPADGPSAFGLRNVKLLILDELAQWPRTRNSRQVFEAAISTLPKTPGARLLAMTSAGDPSHFAYGVRERAAVSDRWRLSELEGTVPWIDPADLEEQKALLTPSAYARLHENQWVSPDDALVTAEDLAAAVSHDGPLRYDGRWRYVAALDLGLVNDRSVLVVAHAEPVEAVWSANVRTMLNPGMRVVVDRIDVWQGTKREPVDLAEVEKTVEQTAWSYRCVTVFDPWQSAGMQQRLAARQVPTKDFIFSSSSTARLAGTLHSLLRARMLALPDDPDLLDELSRVRLVERGPGLLRIDHQAGDHDDRAVCVAMAAHELTAGDIGHPAVPHVVIGARWANTGRR